jgi:hypothetical protein
MLAPPLPHVHFFRFSDTCSLGSNGSTKFLSSMLSKIPFQRVDPALVLECYGLKMVPLTFLGWEHLVMTCLQSNFHIEVIYFHYRKSSIHSFGAKSTSSKAYSKYRHYKVPGSFGLTDSSVKLDQWNLIY